MQVIIWVLAEEAEPLIQKLEETHASYISAAEQTASAIVALRAAVQANADIRAGKKLKDGIK